MSERNDVSGHDVGGDGAADGVVNPPAVIRAEVGDGLLAAGVPPDEETTPVPAEAGDTDASPSAGGEGEPTEQFDGDAAAAEAEAHGDATTAMDGAVGEGSEEIAFYRAEAGALAERQEERAALMWADAARVAELDGGPPAMVRHGLKQALKLRPNAAWVLARARRASMRIRAYEDAVKLGQRELKLGGEVGNRVALLLEAAAVVRYQLGRPKVALQLVQAALKLQQHDVAALTAAATLSDELGLASEAATAQELLGKYLTDPAQRALSFYSAGTLREWRLEEIEAARGDYLGATEADPQNIPAALALAELDRATRRWPELCRTLEHLADLIDDGSTRAELLLEAGTLHLDQTNDLLAAARDFGRAARCAPQNGQVLERLAYVYEAEGRTREAIQALRQLEALTRDTDSRATLLARIGDLYAGLGEIEQAIAAYREAMAQVPGYLPAVQALGTLYRDQGDFEGLVEVTRLENESALPAAARAIRYVELGDILDQQLDRCEEALDAYRQAIALVPDMHLAYWKLTALLKRLGWQEELAVALGDHAMICEDSRSRCHLLVQRAALQGEALGDDEGALETLQAAAEHGDPATVSFNRIDLYQRAGRYGDCAEVMLAHAETATDANEAEHRRIQAALLIEQKLGERERALTILKDVLAANPKSYAAIHAIGRIVHRLGAWEELVKLYHHELKNDPDRPDAAVLLCRMAHVIDESLGRSAAAITAYAKALAKDPSYTPALVGIERLVRAEGRWQELVAVLRGYAEACGDADAAAAAFCQAADVAASRLDQTELAAELFEQAAAREPRSSVALHGLLRVRLVQRSWPEAANALRRLIDIVDADERRAILELQLARVCELALEEPPDTARYERLARGPFGHQLREELMRVRRLTDSESLDRHLAALAGRIGDDALAASYLLDAAYLREFAAADGEQTLDAARQAYQRQPSSLAVVWAYERALIRQGCWAELATMAEQQAQLELDRNVRVQQLAATAQAYWRVGNAEDAGRVARESLNFDAHCLAALRTLAEVARAKQEWRQLAELCDRLAEASAERGNRLRYCLEAADLWLEEVQDVTRALGSLAVALAEDPSFDEAATRAETLLRDRGDFDELSRLYQRRIRACSASEVKADLRWRHAQLLRADLDQPERAISELNELLRLLPNESHALSQLAKLHAELGHWSDAAVALEQLIEHTQDAAIRRKARLKLTGLLIDRLRDLPRARIVLQQAENDGGDDAHALRLRVRLAFIGGDWVDARALLEEHAQRSEGAERLWALFRLAEVARHGEHDADLARARRGEAYGEAIEHPGAVVELCRSLPKREEKLAIIDALEQVPADDESAVAVHVPEELARVLIEELKEPERALVHLDRVGRMAPGRPSAGLLRGAALEQRGMLAEASAEFRSVVESDSRCVSAYRGLIRCDEREVAASAGALVQLLGGELDEEEARSVLGADQRDEARGSYPSELLRLPGGHEVVDNALALLEPAVTVLLAPPAEAEVLRVDDPAAVVARRLARMLDIHELYVARGEGGAVSVNTGEPPTLALPLRLLEQPDSSVFRFWVGRALALTHHGAALLRVGERDLPQLFEAISERKPASSDAQRLRKKLLAQLPRKVRPQLDELVGIDPSRFAAYREARSEIGDRAGLVLSRDVATAIAEISALHGTSATQGPTTPTIEQLMRFAVSDDFAQAHRSVWR